MVSEVVKIFLAAFVKVVAEFHPQSLLGRICWQEKGQIYLSSEISPLKLHLLNVEVVMNLNA